MESTSSPSGKRKPAIPAAWRQLEQLPVDDGAAERRAMIRLTRVSRRFDQVAYAISILLALFIWGLLVGCGLALWQAYRH